MLYNPSMCKVHAAAAMALAIGLAGGTARAQPSPGDASSPRHGRHASGSGQPGQTTSSQSLGQGGQPLNLRRGQYGSDAFTAAGRSKMASGDCDGALEDFDAALRTQATDPSLYRDRGICHEKLGHLHPAIDDYRVYLTDAPDAPDADGIRARLSRLEDEASGRTETANPNDDTDVPPANASSAPDVPPPPGAAHESGEADADMDPDFDNGVRRAKGFSFSPWFSLRHWSFKDMSFIEAQDWAEAVGGQLRYSFGRTGALVVEAGYEHFNSTTVDDAVISGLTSLIGLELRFPLNKGYDDQLLLTPGVGYDHLSYNPANTALQSEPANAFIPRLRFGYRHMLLPGTALDFSLDAGVALYFATNETDLNLSSTFVLGLNVGIVWAL